MTEKKEAKHCDIAPFNILFQDLFTIPLSRYTIQFFNEYLPASSHSFSMILTPEVAKHWSHPGSHLQTFNSHILHSPHYDRHNWLNNQREISWNNWRKDKALLKILLFPNTPILEGTLIKKRLYKNLMRKLSNFS